MARRSKLEIHLDVLQIVKSGVCKPTRIMYEANLSWDHLNRVLGVLMDQSLVSEEDTSGQRRRDKRTSHLYMLTQKGEGVVRYFNSQRSMVSVVLGFLGIPVRSSAFECCLL